MYSMPCLVSNKAALCLLQLKWPKVMKKLRFLSIFFNTLNLALAPSIGTSLFHRKTSERVLMGEKTKHIFYEKLRLLIATGSSMFFEVNCAHHPVQIL